ncbi:MAG: histidine--tRNA ligase [Deltaproteobacteria bacterium]|nr:MAG: histidine--tRNA ligase [Deltaproteobacteria bacterium]
MTIPSVKGFRDVLPADAARRRLLLDAAVRVLEQYGYQPLEVPLLERGELFQRSVGATTDIVEKEMYSFEDRDGTLVALRPEGTASVVRAYVEAGLARSMPVAKFYYHGPMFRRERPQKGRLRQFTQIGAELFGRADPEADAETLCLVADLCEAAGLAGARIRVNSLGDEVCRPKYRESLVAFGRARIERLCRDCRERLERNPLRLLDCKAEQCREATADAPVMIDYLCGDCRHHHDRVLELVAAQGVELEIEPRMVRGLDYYCRTAFEVSAAGLGAQDAVGGGGRYDGLVEQLGGPSVPGIGFAFGLERMELAAEIAETPPATRLFVAPIGEAAAGAALSLARRLRRAGVGVELGSSAKRLKAHLKRAAKDGIRHLVIVGDDELASGVATVRDLEVGRDMPGCFRLDAPAAEILAALERKGESA